MLRAELQKGDIVVFERYFPILQKEDYQDSNIVSVNLEKKTAFICYLDGWKSELDNIPFKKIIAKHDENGEYMKIGLLSGMSVL